VDRQLCRAVIVSIMFHAGLIGFSVNDKFRILDAAIKPPLVAVLVVNQSELVRSIPTVQQTDKRPVVSADIRSEPLTGKKQAGLEGGEGEGAKQFSQIEMLSRKPILIGEPDLAGLDFGGGASEGEIDLLILVGVSGFVEDVSITASTVRQSLYAERVAERFRNVRFLPGMLNGKLVKSSIRITVVAESLPDARSGELF
jgi:hypothetical protein